ncbi:MAG: hypothetical protein JO247_13320 [Chloroflexi bacterium]|nr:hypothetical protein [Chloroflexota bacterium]
MAHFLRDFGARISHWSYVTVNKAIVGVFPDKTSAARAINDLKAYGFGGETMHQTLRMDMLPGTDYPGRHLMPGMEVLKGLVIGAIVGGVLGGVANYFLNMVVSWPTTYGSYGPLLTAVITMAIVGAVCGLLEGCAAAGPLSKARRHLQMHTRGDAIVSVSTDEAHAASADEIMRGAGAVDVRRGAGSVDDEFRTVEHVQPETYGTTQVVTREPVEAPSSEVTSAPATTTPDGGAIG